MEAKDTVMEKVGDRIIDNLLQTQAEISFKAGYQAGVEKASYILPLKFKKARLAGIREVVEWIEEQGEETFRTGYYPSHKMWQAFKKERGL